MRRDGVLVPAFAVAPVLVLQFPLLVRRDLAGFEARQLFFLADLQPEIQQNDAAVDELLFEIVDFSERPPPFVVTGEALDALEELCEFEGILTALETAHAFAGAREWAKENPGKRILLVAQKAADLDDPQPSDLYEVGTVATMTLHSASACGSELNSRCVASASSAGPAATSRGR